MNRGKNICKHLKEIRKRIAEENDIPLEIKECTYKGECRGTCPRCEAEVRYLENALANRIGHHRGPDAGPLGLRQRRQQRKSVQGTRGRSPQSRHP